MLDGKLGVVFGMWASPPICWPFRQAGRFKEMKQPLSMEPPFRHLGNGEKVALQREVQWWSLP